MKTKFNNRELCHVWSSQSQEYGHASNLTFSGKKLQSYGWYTIGMFINHNTVLIRGGRYSRSTSKHITYMCSSLSSEIEKIGVNSLPDYLTEHIDHEKNIEAFVNDINNLADKFRKAKTMKKIYYNEYERARINMNKYCELFNIDLPTNYTILEYSFVLEEIEKERAKIEAKEKKEKENEILAREWAKLELIELSKNWISGGTDKTFCQITIGKKNYYFSIGTILRVKNKEVETSRGAKVPLKEAELLYNRIRHGKDVKGHKIGNYTVISINGTLKIGCHEIERSEIDRFATSQNW